MSEPFVGEVIIFAGTFAPSGWALCQGQTLAISSNTALFSLLGTTYGGNGSTTFALPNLQSCVPIGYGQGPGLSNYVLGQTGGSETVSLLASNLPSHNHALNVSSGNATQSSPSGAYLATSELGSGRSSETVNTYAAAGGATMALQAVGLTGSNTPVPNMQPYVAVNYIIALQGVYPPRS